MAPAIADVNLEFRPKSYFWPMGLDTHLLARVKGAERKAALKRLIEQGRLDEVSEFLAASSLSGADRIALGRLHPSLMGGEYLPNLGQAEVMIARIVIASTTQDVTCVYASRGKSRIHYRVVDEYRGDTLSARSARTSTAPLSLRELEVFFNGAWSLLDVLERNFAEEGYDLVDMQDFVVSIDSDFYPQLDTLYRMRIASLASERQAQCAR